MTLQAAIADAVAQEPVPAGTGADRKNYTERLSRRLTTQVAQILRDAGLAKAQAPSGRDKQFMGGYGTKGVDVFLADEKHGLMLSAGVKGIVFDVGKNIKSRYRDIAMEALELHTRFPYAVCGHLVFLGRSDSLRASKAFGTVLGEAAALLSAISGRVRPDEAPALYEAIGVVLLDPGAPDSVLTAHPDLPPALHGETLPERLASCFRRRNPFYGE